MKRYIRYIPVVTVLLALLALIVSACGADAAYADQPVGKTACVQELTADQLQQVQEAIDQDQAAGQPFDDSSTQSLCVVTLDPVTRARTEVFYTPASNFSYWHRYTYVYSRSRKLGRYAILTDDVTSVPVNYIVIHSVYGVLDDGTMFLPYQFDPGSSYYRRATSTTIDRSVHITNIQYGKDAPPQPYAKATPPKGWPKPPAPAPKASDSVGTLDTSSGRTDIVTVKKASATAVIAGKQTTSGQPVVTVKNGSTATTVSASAGGGNTPNETIKKVVTATTVARPASTQSTTKVTTQSTTRTTTKVTTRVTTAAPRVTTRSPRP